MDTAWGTVTQVSPLLLRLAGDLSIDTPVSLTNGDTFAVGDKVALIKIGVKWWAAGKIVVT